MKSVKASYAFPIRQLREYLATGDKAQAERIKKWRVAFTVLVTYQEKQI